MDAAVGHRRLLGQVLFQKKIVGLGDAHADNLAYDLVRVGIEPVKALALAGLVGHYFKAFVRGVLNLEVQVRPHDRQFLAGDNRLALSDHGAVMPDVIVKCAGAVRMPNQNVGRRKKVIYPWPHLHNLVFHDLNRAGRRSQHVDPFVHGLVIVCPKVHSSMPGVSLKPTHVVALNRSVAMVFKIAYKPVNLVPPGKRRFIDSGMTCRVECYRKCRSRENTAKQIESEDKKKRCDYHDKSLFDQVY